MSYFGAGTRFFRAAIRFRGNRAIDLRGLQSSLGRLALLVIFVSTCVHATTNRTEAAPKVDTSIFADDFKWFDGLGYPDVKNAKLVRVKTGGWSQSGDDEPVGDYQIGFLIGSDGEKFTVFGSDLSTVTYQRSPATTPARERVDYEPQTPKQILASCRKEREASAKDPFHRMRFSQRTSQAAELFVLAWGCAKLGFDAAAVELYELAAEAPSDRNVKDAPKTVRGRIAEDMAHTEMWSAILAFGELSVGRPELLKSFERIVKNYPESSHHERAKETAELLQRMIAEDVEHAAKRKAGKPFAELSKDDQIADLVFQLRDQNGHQWSQPGSCDVFMTGSDKEDSPAHQLVKYGYDAVPRLIEALDDVRFSRSVGFHRDFYFSHSVLRVADCAEQVVSVIAGRSFYESPTTSGYMVKDGKAKTTKQLVAEWYAELKKKGEKQTLIDTVAVGDRQAAQLAERLVDKFPDDALAPLIAGTRHAKEDWVRANLVAEAGRLKGDAPVPFLLEELKSASKLESRLAAARALHARGRSEAVEAMIAQWRKPAEKKVSDPRFSSDYASEGLLRFLATSGKVAAIEALAEKFSECRVGVRLSIVEMFGRRGSSMSRVSTGSGPSVGPLDALGSNAPKELRLAALKLLLTALDDREERTGMSGSWGDKSFSDPRICDMTAHVLYTLDTKRYPFDLEADAEQRTLDCAKLTNVLRAELGLAALPLPTTRAIKPVAEAELMLLLEQLEKADSDRDRTVEAKIVGLGLGALAPIIARRDKLPSDDARRGKLDALARRVASIVVELTPAAKSVAPDAELRKKLDALKGRPLDSSEFQQLITSLIEELPAGIGGIGWRAARSKSGGVTMELDLIDRKRADLETAGGGATPGSAAPFDRPFNWSYSVAVRLAGKSLYEVDGGGTNPPGVRNEPRLTEALEQIEAAAVEKPFEIRWEAIGQWRK